VASICPVAVKSSASLRCPSWKMNTIAPKVADRLRTLSTSALIGMITEPNCMNITMNVTSAMIPRARGSLANSASLMSTSSADCPATRTGNGASVARIRSTSCSPSAENGSTSGTTDR
jgi:hypothetical protein